MIGRRRVGVAGLKQSARAKETFRAVGQQLEAAQLEHMTKLMTAFKENLTAFAQKHKKEINKNPEFRAQFQRMCAKAGVDPLASNKGFWAQMLGVGDFYYELSVQAMEVCISTRSQNGGLLSLEELVSRLRARRGKQSQAISEEDVRYALGKLSCLGSGFRLLTFGSGREGRVMVVSVPVELNRDHTALMELASQPPSAPLAYLTISGVCSALKWPQARVETVLDLLLREGMVWVDTQAGDGHETLYWFPSLFTAGVATGTGAEAGSGAGAG